MIKRPESHIKETRSLAYVDNIWAEWAVNKLDKDYGIDLDIVIFENNEATNINFYAQLKSTDNIKTKNSLISYPIDTKHLIYFFNQSRPFIFILYDNQNAIAYWLIIQDYIWDILNEKTLNWRNQDYNTLYFPVENKIEDKTKVKEAVMNSGKRIIQENWYKLRVGDGLGLNNTLKDMEKLEKFEKSAELKIKETKLMHSKLLIHSGNIEKANIKLMEIYNQNKQDLMHLKSIIALASQLNIADVIQNEKLVNYCIDGIKLARELKNTVAESILVVAKNRAIIFLLIEKIGKLLYSRKINSQLEDPSYLIFIDKEFEEVTEIFIALNEEINEIINNSIKNKDYYILISSLAGVLDISSIIIQKYKTFDGENEKIEEEIQSKIELSKYLLDIITIFNDEAFELAVKSSVAWFYYYSEKPEALNLMRDALEIAIRSNNKPQIQRIEELVKIIEENPNPFDIEKKSVNLQRLTTKEFQELLKKSLEYRGIDFSSEDYTAEAILLGLKDADPEKYFKYCKNIYIAYLSTSSLGHSIGLHSLGSKMIYCPYGEYWESVNLKLLFDSLVEDYCKNCDKREPRDPNWKCKVKWVEEMRESDIVQNLLRERYERSNYQK